MVSAIALADVLATIFVWGLGILAALAGRDGVTQRDVRSVFGTNSGAEARRSGGAGGGGCRGGKVCSHG